MYCQSFLRRTTVFVFVGGFALSSLYGAVDAARFIDKEPEFIFVPPDEVIAKAQELDAIPYDVHGVELTHDGELCSFDAFLEQYKLDEPELRYLVQIRD